MLKKRSVSLKGHRTAVALEPEFWAAVEAQARAAGQSLAAYIADIDAARPPDQGLASALRVAALRAAISRTGP